MPDGPLRLDVRLTIKTNVGELIFVEYNGVVGTNKEVMDRFSTGEAIIPEEVYFVTAPLYHRIEEVRMAPSDARGG